MSAIKTAIPTLVFSAISDAATIEQEINKVKNKNKKQVIRELDNKYACYEHRYSIAFYLLTDQVVDDLVLAISDILDGNKMALLYFFWRYSTLR